MSKWITCKAVGVYPDALTRGKEYEVLGDRADGAIRLRGDNDRVRWFPGDLFALDGSPVPTLVRWWFEHEPAALPGDDGQEDVEFELSDGSVRWCSFATPAHLRTLVEQAIPGFWSPTLVVVRRLAPEDIEAMLRHLDQQGELTRASNPMGGPVEPEAP